MPIAEVAARPRQPFGYQRHVDAKVDAVEQRPGHAPNSLLAPKGATAPQASSKGKRLSWSIEDRLIPIEGVALQIEVAEEGV